MTIIEAFGLAMLCLIGAIIGAFLGNSVAEWENRRRK